MQGNAQKARDLVRHLALALPVTRAPSPIDTALDGALVTAPSARDAALVKQLSAIIGRALKSDPP